MIRACLVLFTLAVTVDRVAIVVGNRVVKTSDIERDLRASQFLNKQPLDVSVAAKRKVADRLIEQELIRQEIKSGGYATPGEGDVNAFLTQLRQSRYGNSETQLRGSLAPYGLTVEQLRTYLWWQLTVLRFIDERFRPGVLVTDEDAQAYAESHRITPEKARETIAGERVNQAFEDWLEQTKRRIRVEYREEAFADK